MASGATNFPIFCMMWHERRRESATHSKLPCCFTMGNASVYSTLCGHHSLLENLPSLRVLTRRRRLTGVFLMRFCTSPRGRITLDFGALLGQCGKWTTKMDGTSRKTSTDQCFRRKMVRSLAKRGRWGRFSMPCSRWDLIYNLGAGRLWYRITEPVYPGHPWSCPLVVPPWACCVSLGRQARVYYQNSMKASACSVQLIPGGIEYWISNYHLSKCRSSWKECHARLVKTQDLSSPDLSRPVDNGEFRGVFRPTHNYNVLRLGEELRLLGRTMKYSGTQATQVLLAVLPRPFRSLPTVTVWCSAFIKCSQLFVVSPHLRFRFSIRK